MDIWLNIERRVFSSVSIQWRIFKEAPSIERNENANAVSYLDLGVNEGLTEQKAIVHSVINISNEPNDNFE